MTGAERSTATAAGQLWQAAGHESFAEIMILALAMSHIVERPAIRMEGGPSVLWSGTPAAVWKCPEYYMVINQIRADMDADFVVMSFMMKPISRK